MILCISEGCQNSVEGRTEYCASCNYERRREERRANKVTIAHKPNKVSTKRAGQIQEYNKLRSEYLALYPVCEVEDCHERSSEIHHQKGKEGDRLLDTNYFLAVCRDHHMYYTEHSKEAVEKGISFKRTV